MEKRRDIFRRVKEHRKTHTTCSIKLKGDTIAIEKRLKSCEESLSVVEVQSDYTRWLCNENIRLLELVSFDFPKIETAEDLKEKKDDLARHIRVKMDEYTLSEEEGDSYFTFFYPLTKYFFHTVSYRKELQDRYKAAFPGYDEVGEDEKLSLGIWRFTLREMKFLETEGVRDIDIVTILRGDCNDLFEDIMDPLYVNLTPSPKLKEPLTEKSESSAERTEHPPQIFYNFDPSARSPVFREPLGMKKKMVLIAKTELVSFFMGLLSPSVKVEFARIPESRVSEFPWGVKALKTLLYTGILPSNKISMLPELWMRTQKAALVSCMAASRDLAVGLKIQLSRSLERKDDPGMERMAMNILNLTWINPDADPKEQKLQINEYDHELLHKRSVLELLKYVPGSQKEFAKLLDEKVSKKDNNDLKYLFGMQDLLDKHTLALREDEGLSLCLLMLRMGLFDLIEKMNFLNDIRRDFRFISALAGLKDTNGAFKYIEKLGIDINGGSGMLLRSCCKYIKSPERRASFRALMLDAKLLVNLKTRSNPLHAILYLLDTSYIEYLLATDAIELFAERGLVLSKRELAEALKLLEKLTFGIDVKIGEFRGLKDNLKAYKAMRYAYGGGEYKAITAVKKKWKKLLVDSQKK